MRYTHFRKGFFNLLSRHKFFSKQFTYSQIIYFSLLPLCKISFQSIYFWWISIVFLDFSQDLFNLSNSLLICQWLRSKNQWLVTLDKFMYLIKTKVHCPRFAHCLLSSVTDLMQLRMVSSLLWHHSRQFVRNFNWSCRLFRYV